MYIGLGLVMMIRGFVDAMMRAQQAIAEGANPATLRPTTTRRYFRRNMAPL